MCQHPAEVTCVSCLRFMPIATGAAAVLWSMCRAPARCAALRVTIETLHALPASASSAPPPP
eukprot:6195310-Pleurochrysis_carterae.AAC.3